MRRLQWRNATTRATCKDPKKLAICNPSIAHLSIALVSDKRLGSSETFAPSPRNDRMATGKSILERAFEIAVSGEVTSLRQLARALRAEGYDATEIVAAGRVLRRQLNELMAAARPDAGGSTLH
jgi:hypothetical protein